MMTRSKSLASRLRELFLDGRWIANTNYRELIQSVSREQATRRIGNLNTIAALTFHVGYYVGGVLNVLEGGALEIRDKYSFDMPPVETDADWREMVQTFIRNAERFAGAVENLPDGKLDEPFVDEKYGTYLRNIEGMLEHGYYHLGQISLVRKLVAEDAVKPGESG